MKTAQWGRPVIACILLALIGCKGGGGGSDSGGSSEASPPPTEPPTATTRAVSSTVQKGPFQMGSEITIRELNASYVQTGKVFTTTTTDDLGSFSMPEVELSRYIELEAEGYFFDEVTGQPSGGEIILNALVDLEQSPSPSMNLITTLQMPRLKKLLSQGQTYATADRQSLEEVLSAFNIRLGDTTIGSAANLSITGSTDDDAVLMGLSTLLSQASYARTGTVGGSIASSASGLIAAIAQDLADDGTLDSTALRNEMTDAGKAVDLERVRANTEKHYHDKGHTVFLPTFEEWVDADGSGQLPQRRPQAAGAAFENATNVEPFQVITSNPVTISTGTSDTISMEVDREASIVKNNVALNTHRASVVDGDVVRVQVQSKTFGNDIAVGVRIGDSQSTWTVTTRTPELGYRTREDAKHAPFPEQESFFNGRPTSLYHANPIEIEVDFVARYFASGMAYNNGSRQAKSVAIHADNNGEPGNKLYEVSTYTKYFDVTTKELVIKSTQQMQGDFWALSVHQFAFGPQGLALKAGDRLWVVYETDMSQPDTLYKHWGAGMPDFAVHMSSDDGVTWVARDETPWSSFTIFVD